MNIETVLMEQKREAAEREEQAAEEHRADLEAEFNYQVTRARANNYIRDDAMWDAVNAKRLAAQQGFTIVSDKSAA